MSSGAVLTQGVEQGATQQAETLKQQQLKQMGEDKGVARNASVVLESNTARIGRKCDSVSCLARENVGGTAFKRCGACRYASVCGLS